MERVLLTSPPPSAGAGAVSAGAGPTTTGPTTTGPTTTERTTQDVTRLRKDASLEPGTGPEPGGLSVVGPWCSLAFRALSPGVVEALTAFARADRTESDLLTAALQDGPTAAFRLQLVLRRLDAEGLLDHAVLDAAGRPLARLRPIGRGATRLRPAPDGGEPVKLSRFAVARAEGGGLVVSAPGSHLAVDLAPSVAGLLGAISGWASPAAAADALGRLPSPDVAAVLRLFAAADVLAPGDPERDLEHEERSRAQWAPADLWLHARSRNPKTVSGYGGTYQDVDRFEPLPAADEPLGTRTVRLPVPELARIERHDPPLTTVLERRRSVREHDDTRPIALGQLSELLYRTARMRGTFTGGDGQVLADRPYPCGGAVHELEIYPLVTFCAGLDPGLWHYRADHHALELAAEPGAETQALVAAARGGALMETDPQVTLIVTARFGRVMWKYETVGYPLILKHVGVLYQTLYLVGEAMGLAVCGLGGGDASDFAAATGLDPLAEGSVGELVVGSRPAVLRHPVGVPRADASRPAAPDAPAASFPEERRSAP